MEKYEGGTSECIEQEYDRWSRETVIKVSSGTKPACHCRPEVHCTRITLVTVLLTRLKLREQIDLVSLQQSDQFQHLNKRTREILDAAIDNRDIFKSFTDSHLTAIQQMHIDTNIRIIEQHNLTRSTIIEAVESTSRQSIEKHEVTRHDLQLHTDVLCRVQAETNTIVVEQHEQTRTHIIETAQLVNQRNLEEHEITRREISQLKQALEYLKEEFGKKDAELKELLKAFGRERSPRKRRQWQKLSNAASAALFKLESLCRILLVSNSHIRFSINIYS
jgi:hypothetical protein